MKTRGRDGAKRRLAAILAADVVGYSRLMGQDEFQLNFEPRVLIAQSLGRCDRTLEGEGHFSLLTMKCVPEYGCSEGVWANRCRDARSPREHVVALIIAARGLGQ